MVWNRGLEIFLNIVQTTIRAVGQTLVVGVKAVRAKEGMARVLHLEILFQQSKTLAGL